MNGPKAVVSQGLSQQEKHNREKDKDRGSHLLSTLIVLQVGHLLLINGTINIGTRADNRQISILCELSLMRICDYLQKSFTWSTLEDFTQTVEYKKNIK